MRRRQFIHSTAAEDAEIGLPGKLVGIEQEIKPCVLKFYDNIDILLGSETYLIIGMVLHGAYYMKMETHIHAQARRTTLAILIW